MSTPDIHAPKASEQSLPPTHADLARLAGERAENLYRTRQMRCAEAVIHTLNRGLCGGAPDDLAMAMGTGFCGGMGDAGCGCGALTGGVLALGLFLGRRTLGLGNGKGARSAAKAFHDRFRQEAGAACCRVLVKPFKAKDDGKPTKEQRQGRFDQCARLTGLGARLAAQTILQARPALADTADTAFLLTRDTAAKAAIKRAAGAAPG